MTLFKRSKKTNSPYYVRFQLRGDRRTWCTGTPDKATAKARAADYKFRCEQDGFEATTGFRRRQEQPMSIAEAITRYEGAAITTVRPATIRGNVKCLKLVCKTVGLSLDEPLTSLREETVWEFEKRRLLGEGKDAAGDGTTRRTVKSVMRQARSIFAARFLVRKTFGSVHGQLDGFRLAPLAKAPKCRYTLPSTNLIDRTWQALPGLTETDPSATVAFLLAATAGLRKGEIAAARWDWIDWERGTMHIRCEHDFTPKSGEERLVGIPADVLGRLKDMRRPGRYVLPGTDTERKELVFRRLSAWMRDLGWNRVKTVHELRKLFGAQVATQAGLYVAQRALGHASPTVTNDHYADLVNAPKLNIRTA